MNDYDESSIRGFAAQRQQQQRDRAIAIERDSANKIGTEARQESREIDRELTRLTNAIEDLQNVAEGLAKRLQAVLAPVPETVAKSERPVEACGSDLGGSLQRQALAVEATTSSLRALIRSLAL